MSGYIKKMETYQRGYAEVDLDRILENIKQMKKKLKENTKMLGVIKADGYGHGSISVARCLEPLDFMYGFAVATAEEAHILRYAGIRKPVVILGYTFPYAYERIAREEVRPAVFRKDSLEALSEAAAKAGKKIKVHVKVDTGMGRIGITPDDEGLAFIGEVLKRENLEIEGIFTHFAKADERDKTSAYRQLALFRDFVEKAEKTFGISIPLKHCANSAAILEMPEAELDLVRAGIVMYGLAPSDEVRGENIPLRPALSLYSTVVYVKTIHAGESVSYGSLFTAKKDTRVATVPLGYGDGYPRSLSCGKGFVLIRGQRAPILGRICMDQFMVDVSDIPGAKEGDRVTLIGFDGGEQISAELLGELSGRFAYEFVSDLGKRTPRVYLREGKVVGTWDEMEEYEK